MLKSEHISGTEMRALLREAYAQDPEKSFFRRFTRGLCDPAMPQDSHEHLRFHPLWLVLGLISALVGSVFVFFTLRS